MKILVTGAAGFIGFHLVEALLKCGEEVVGIDNINDYYDVNLKYARLEKSGIFQESISDNQVVASVNNSNYRFQKTDIVDRDALYELFDKEQFDVVVHLAAQPGVRYSLENPYIYVQANVVGFLNILESCRHNKVKHLVYASSSSVYGMNDDVPFNENDKVDYPVSLYAATKKSNELMAHTNSHLYKLPTTGLRFFTVYGPWGRPDMAPMLFADAIAKGETIKVFNNGDMERDFTFVNDIIEGVVRATKSIPSHEDNIPYYRLFNIGNSNPVKLLEFIRKMEEAMGIHANLEMYPMQPGDVKVTYADTSALEKSQGYKPSTPIESGLNDFISWYKEHYSL